MSRFPRLRRRPDHWGSAHERARARAAERLDGPLGLAESTWLDEHLATCPECAAIAAAYEADRLALRGLRDQMPEPPRDLWARTAAAIEAESASRGRSAAPAARRGARRIPLGATSGIAVILVVIGLSAVSSGLLGGIGGSGGSVALAPSGAPSADVAAEGASGSDGTATLEGTAIPTPLAVGAGRVQWVRTDSDGAVAYNSAPVDEVCPVDGGVDCATLDDLDGERIAIVANPKSIISSPDQQQAVVVSEDESGGQRITVVALPIDQDTARPSTSPTPVATEPAATVQPSEAAPSASQVAPTEEPVPTDTVPSASPTDVPATPSLSPEPTVATTLAIAQGIRIVGESAAFSADGAWFAFTATAADGSGGPDVYLWHVGDETARQLTTDGISTFASWDGTTVLVSRVAAMGDTAGGESPLPLVMTPETVSIDPETGTEASAGSWWRPIVDPTGDHAVAWVGSLATTPDPAVTVPDEGRLELRSWPPADGQTDGDGVQVVADGVAADFDVRWDETGDWFATWIGDPAGTSVGRLSLFRVDPETGLLQHPEGAPVDVAALPGFSIGQGRLAWATPPGQGGEGSRVQVVAWSDDAVGTVETAPGEDVVVVR